MNESERRASWLAEKGKLTIESSQYSIGSRWHGIFNSSTEIDGVKIQMEKIGVGDSIVDVIDSLYSSVSAVLGKIGNDSKDDV